jgi:hypothetical protein
VLESLNAINLRAIQKAIEATWSQKNSPPNSQWLKRLEKRGSGKPTKDSGPPDGNTILILAERYGQLPDTIENEMSEYWFNRAVAQLEGETLDRKRRNDELARKRK